MEKTIETIQLILNTKKRLEDLKPIFQILHDNKIGKYNNNHYCVKSNVKLNRQQSEADITFNMLQQDAYQKGFSTNCFCLSIEV